MILLDGDDPRRVYVVAHRGFSGKAPENTLAAFTLAMEEGVDMLELDVRLTKDDEVVVIHDANVGRTTNGRGRVQDMTLEELKSLDAGSWFARRFSGETIPTLREVLSMVNDRTYLNVEVKSERLPSDRRVRLEMQCLQILTTNHMEQRVLVSSFDHRLIKRIKQRVASLNGGVIYKVVRDLGKTPAGLARRSGADFFICSKRQITRRMVQNAHKHNVKVGVYTVDTPREIERMLRLGVDLIISNFPDIVLRLIGR